MVSGKGLSLELESFVRAKNHSLNEEHDGCISRTEDGEQCGNS